MLLDVDVYFVNQNLVAISKYILTNGPYHIAGNFCKVKLSWVVQFCKFQEYTSFVDPEISNIVLLR